MKNALLVNGAAGLLCLAVSGQAQQSARPRPAIDAAAPSKTETATFALG
jgi:hypothetical protein